MQWSMLMQLKLNDELRDECHYAFECKDSQVALYNADRCAYIQLSAHAMRFLLLFLALGCIQMCKNVFCLLSVIIFIFFIATM